MSNVVIWKAVLNPLMPPLQLLVPEGTEFLSAAEQRGEICVWYRCDPSKSVVQRNLAIVGTGYSNCPVFADHIGTVILHNGELVLHVFAWPEGQSDEKQDE